MSTTQIDRSPNKGIVVRLCKKVVPRISFLHFRNLFFALVYLRRRFKDSFDECVKNLKSGSFDLSRLMEICPRVWRIVDLDKAFDDRDKDSVLSAIEDVVKGVGELQIPEDEDVIGEFFIHLLHGFCSIDGRHGGQYFTPRSLSKLIHALASTHYQNINGLTVYDPTSGSGSLLLRFSRWPGVRLYGQEIDRFTHSLSVLNLEGAGVDSSGLMFGDTLAKDMHVGKEFDIVVANPPFSIRGEPLADQSHRFQLYGTAPKNRADGAFVHHMLNKTKETGIVVTLCYGGMLGRGKVEEAIRRRFLEAGKIRAVIGLPENLFYGTTIGVCLLIMTQVKNERVLFIDAEREYIKSPDGNFMSDANVQRVLETYKQAIEMPGAFAGEVGYSKLVDVKKILETEETSLTPRNGIDSPELVRDPEESKAEFLQSLDESFYCNLKLLSLTYKHYTNLRGMGDLTEKMTEFLNELEKLKPFWEKHLCSE